MMLGTKIHPQCVRIGDLKLYNAGHVEMQVQKEMGMNTAKTSAFYPTRKESPRRLISSLNLQH